MKGSFEETGEIRLNWNTDSHLEKRETFVNSNSKSLLHLTLIGLFQYSKCRLQLKNNNGQIALIYWNEPKSPYPREVLNILHTGRLHLEVQTLCIPYHIPI